MRETNFMTARKIKTKNLTVWFRWKNRTFHILDIEKPVMIPGKLFMPLSE